MAHVKLHIPGPVEVSAKTFQAMTQPMIGHRGQGFKDLYGRIQPQLQTLLSTRQRAYLSTSSAWGVMEGALTNLCSKKVLNCMCGAFSDKWFDVAKKLGKDAEALQVPWGSPIRAEQIDARLATGQFDALTLIHNETSTGTMSPLDEIAALKRKYPDVMFIVDAVSSLTAVPHRFDDLGIEYLPGYPARSHWINERLRVVHGDKVASGGSTAHKYLGTEKTSVIYGHIHRVEYAERTREDHDGPKTIMAASPGCLARTDGAVPSTKGGIDLDGRPVVRHEDWQQGLAVVEYEPGDGRFTYEQITIRDGWARWRGRTNRAGEQAA